MNGDQCRYFKVFDVIDDSGTSTLGLRLYFVTLTWFKIFLWCTFIMLFKENHIIHDVAAI